MPAHERAASQDRELVVRSRNAKSSVPMWDSSDPDRAPPPLPMNPGITSPATKTNVSPHIQAVANTFAERNRENTPSPYTTNPMPPKTSPEKSLIKGQYHKRMQSFPNADPRSEFLNYLESRPPEPPRRVSILEPQNTKQREKSPTKAEDSPSSNKDAERSNTPPYTLSSRYLSRPILGENTPPSATMLAIQNMQIPDEVESPSPSPSPAGSNRYSGHPPNSGSNFDTLSAQILGLTNMTSSLQRELAQLSRRSKDNATDLFSLKAATNARDEDLRKGLRELSSNLASKVLEGEGTPKIDVGAFLGLTDPDNSPCSKKSYSVPRMSSPNGFAMAMERELCGSPGPVSDGSASIALLEKVLREMATKEGQKKLLDLLEEMKSRPASNNASDKGSDHTINRMLEEILETLKEHSTSKALVLSKADADHQSHSRQRNDNGKNISREIPECDSQLSNDANRSALQSASATNTVTDELLSMVNRIKNSVIEGGGITNEVKALVRELRGETLGMGRDIARKFEEAEASRSTENDRPVAPGKDEIAYIVDSSLQELKSQMMAIANENRQHSSTLSEFRKALNGTEIYTVVNKALNEFPFPQPESRGANMEKKEILETVREAWETYKPEIELQNFGLERDEILECLTEGLKTYQPKSEDAVTYDQVLNAVQIGMQNFVPPPVQSPPTISKDEIITTIRECLESFEIPVPSVEDEQIAAIREEMVRAASEAITTQGAVTKEAIESEIRGEIELGIKSAIDSGINRDEILHTVSDGIMAHLAAVKEADDSHATKEDVINAVNDALASQQSTLSRDMEPQVTRGDVADAVSTAFAAQQSTISTDNHQHATKEDVVNAVNDAFNSQQSALTTTSVDPTLSREEILRVIAEALENQAPREIELNREDLMEAISAGLHEAVSSDNFNSGDRVLQRLQDLLDGIKEEFRQYSAANGKDTEQVLDAVRDGLHDVKLGMGSYMGSSPDATAKYEIVDTVKEGLGLLQANMEKVVSDAIVSSADRASSNTPELLDAMEKEFEHLRQTISTLLIRSDASSGKDEILDAIRDVVEGQKTSSRGVVSAESKTDRDEIIAALRESFENLREDGGHRKDGGESMMSSTGELLDAFNDGVDAIREDLAKILDKPADSHTGEILDTIKDGLQSLKVDVDALRRSQEGSEDSRTERGRELTLSGDSNLGGGIDCLKVLITQLQDKVEGLESRLQPTVESEGILKKEHLDEILTGLRELQSSVIGSASREIPNDEVSASAKKKDTDTIEMLLRDAKAQLDDMIFPPHHEFAKSDHLTAVENVIKEAKEAVTELSARLEADVPTKTDIGTLEALLRDVFFALDGAKSREVPEGEDSEKLVKTDLQTVEAMIFDVKTQIEELKLPDVETLPTKTEVQELSASITDFREKVDTENELTGQAFEARKMEHGGLAQKIDEAKAVVDELGGELRSKLDGSHEGLSELRQLLEGLMASSENFITVENINDLTQLINCEFERARGEQDAIKSGTEERDATALVKHDETRAAIIVELGSRIDEKLGEVMAKYEQAQNAVDSKFSETEGRDMANLEAVTNVKTIAEDIKLVIGSMGNTVNETCERISGDTKAFLERVDQSCNKIEEMQNESKSGQERSREDFERTIAATGRVETQIHEFHPQILESIQQILSLVDKHYDHSQRAAENFKTEVSSIPSIITPLLPALPSPESTKYDDSQVREKLDSLLEYTVNNGQIQEMLKTLLEQSSGDSVHGKLDTLLERAMDKDVHDKLDSILERDGNAQGAVHEVLTTLLERSTNDRVHEKLNGLLDHATNSNSQIHDKLNDVLERSAGGQVHEKLDGLLDHTTDRNSQFHEMLNTLVERSSNDQLNEKLDGLLDHATNTNNQVHGKLDDILKRSTNDQVHGKLDVLLEQAAGSNVNEKIDNLLEQTTGANGAVNEKLDTIINHTTNADIPVTQMMKLDEMHKDLMQTSLRMNEFFAAQSALITEDGERRRKEAEEAAVVLERRVAQREQVESEVEDLKDEKDSLLKIIQTLKAEKDSLAKQHAKYTKELSSLETALEIRHEEMQLMENRADSLEKRILEGVLDHARSVLLRPSGMHNMNLKRVRSGRGRKNSGGSTTSATKDSRNILGNSVGIALKRRTPTISNIGCTIPHNAGKERRILSLSNITGNRGGGDRQPNSNSGFANLKRSHSVKSNSVLRKASWASYANPVANKENEAVPEVEEEEHDHEHEHEHENAYENENESGEESETGTLRRTSCARQFMSNKRRTSAATSSIIDRHEEEDEQIGEDVESVDGTQAKENTNTNQPQQDILDDEEDNNNTEAEAEKPEPDKELIVYGQHSDSGLGSDVTTSTV